ncbi:MAG: TIGR03915 family putative DNA repair protein [Endomicrobia bacterium]|nr:TIGR03915 family putative DNA repair protein [Endomicrobiia bacterium]MCL2507013.1 TIGR03915 family putative DNA repair protein [Endomicrobiia bacterium]
MNNFKRQNIIYSYDGTFDGFLCCAFESFLRKEIPADIISEKAPQPALLEQFNIETDFEKAGRVKKSIREKISLDAFFLLRDALFTDFPEKEMLMLEFMRLGYKTGSAITSMLSNNTVDKLIKAVNYLHREALRYKEFIRFSEYDGLLIASIKPRNFVLPYTAPHFAQRMPEEKFIIADETNKAVCVYEKRKLSLFDAKDITIPKADEREAFYRNLWKEFYNSVAIKERINPKCQNNLLPKRYRDRMTEFL